MEGRLFFSYYAYKFSSGRYSYRTQAAQAAYLLLCSSLHLRVPSEIINVMEATIKFSPAIPIPLPFDVQKRIQELRSYLDPTDPNYQPEYQNINIRAAIKLNE